MFNIKHLKYMLLCNKNVLGVENDNYLLFPNWETYIECEYVNDGNKKQSMQPTEITMYKHLLPLNKTRRDFWFVIA